MILQEQYESEQLDQFALAMSKAQGKMKRAAKDCSNPFYKSKYADLSSVSDAIKEVFEENKIAVVQRTEDTLDRVTVCTKLIHESGQWVKSKNSMPAFITEKADKYDKSSSAMITRPMNCQEVGSVITYLRRFQLSALAGVCPEDDDGNNVSGKTVITPPHLEKITKEKKDWLLKFLDQNAKLKAHMQLWLSNTHGIRDWADIPNSIYDGLLKNAMEATKDLVSEKSA